MITFTRFPHNSFHLLLLSMAFLSPITSAKNLALSFDDGLDPNRQIQAEKWNGQILTHLIKANVQSIFYVAGHNVDSPKGLELVKDWGNNGQLIANHSYSHNNFASDKTNVLDFIEDIIKNEKLLQSMPNWQKRFRFPYLKEGKTADKRDKLRSWLGKNNYQSGAVSIDASDWYYDKRYLSWLESHPDDDLSIIKEAYLKHLLDRANYYDSLSQQLLKRSADHLLLLHVNAINAAFLGDVIIMFQKAGWNIISPEVAYQDPLYATTTNILPAGESILWSLAKQNNINALRYPAEDSVYEKVYLDSLGL